MQEKIKTRNQKAVLLTSGADFVSLELSFSFMTVQAIQKPGGLRKNRGGTTAIQYKEAQSNVFSTGWGTES